MTEPLRRVAPGVKSDLTVKHLYTNTIFEMPWGHEKYAIHVDHFCGKNGIHSNLETHVMNNYWLLDHNWVIPGSISDRPTDAGTVVVMSTDRGTPRYMWSYANQYRYGTLIRWMSRLLYVAKPAQEDEACFHGLIVGKPDSAEPDPFGLGGLADNCIGFKYEHSDGDGVWHVLIRNGPSVLDLPTNVPITECEWTKFKLIKDKYGNLFFYINDMRNPALAVYADEHPGAIPTDFMAELHYLAGAQLTVTAEIDVSLIKCRNEPLVKLCGREGGEEQ